MDGLEGRGRSGRKWGRIREYDQNILYEILKEFIEYYGRKKTVLFYVKEDGKESAQLGSVGRSVESSKNNKSKHQVFF